MTVSFIVRPAITSDADRIAEIYALSVRETAISFELEPPDGAEMASRIDRSADSHPWLVISEDSHVDQEDPLVLGYAYASSFRARPAYRFTAEVSVYIAHESQGRGLGKRLYLALLDELRRLGARTAIGALTLPNQASQRLHESLGFKPVARFEQVGFKFDAWHDVEFWQLHLNGDAADGMSSQTNCLSS